MSKEQLPNSSQPLKQTASQGRDGIRRYYEQYLRTVYPNWNEMDLAKEINSGLNDERLKRLFENMRKSDEWISENFSDTNWTTWFDNLSLNDK